MVSQELRRLAQFGLLRVPPRVRTLIETRVMRAYEHYLVYSTGDRIDSDRGLPLPPAQMRVQVIGAADAATFVDSGQRQTRFFRTLLERNGIRLDAGSAILDFGCGCGRLARWWQEEGDPKVYGCDPNAPLIAWCRGALGFLNATVSEDDPPLPYTDGSFDLVYAMSIFSHLPRARAQAWMAELRRVLKPGGHLLFTTLGRGHYDRLTEEEAVRFRRGEEVVQFATATGSNLCLVYNSAEDVARHLLEGLDLVDSVLLSEPGIHPESASTQDCYLARRVGAR